MTNISPQSDPDEFPVLKNVGASSERLHENEELHDGFWLVPS